MLLSPNGQLISLVILNVLKIRFTERKLIKLFLLGVRNLAPPTWTLKTVAEESGTYPVLLLLSPGADPCPELKSLAAGHVSQAAGFIEVSLGQGQVNQAEAALQEACR